MKPAPFDYAVPGTVAEALALLRDRDHEEPRLLAGGQSLVPLLNMRFARPSLLVDLNGVEELGGIELADGRVQIGAMVRQRRLETDAAIRGQLPLLAEATAHIAHLAIRTRGTVGGSLAHADPAAELPAAMLALEARLLVRRPDGGTRTLSAAEFFLGPFTTALEADQVLAAVELDLPPPRTGSAFLEVSRVHGAFALAGAAALVTIAGDGSVSRARLALCGVGGAPYGATWLDELRREGHAGYPKMMSIGLHPRWAGQAGRTSALRELIEYGLAQGDVWFARRIDIANWWLAHHEEFER